MAIQSNQPVNDTGVRHQGEAPLEGRMAREDAPSRDEQRLLIHQSIVSLNKCLVSLSQGGAEACARDSYSDSEIIELGAVNYQLFRLQVDQLAEQIQGPEHQKLIDSIDHALSTITCFSERMHKSDYRSLPREETSHSFMIQSISILSAELISNLFPKLSELRSKHDDALRPPQDNPSQPTRFIAPKPERLVKELDSTQLEKQATLESAQALGNRSILSPLEEFLLPYERALHRIGIVAAVATVGTLVYLRPEVRTVAITAILIATYKVTKALLKHYGGEYLRRWRPQLAHRQADERDPFNSGLMDLPERRKVNLGRAPRQRQDDRSIDATDLSKNGVEELRGSHQGRVHYSSELFRQRIGVTASYVTSSSDGRVRRFDALCKEVDEGTPEAPSMYDTWFPLRAVPDAARLARTYGEARIEFSTKSGDRTFPLPVGFRVAGIDLFSRDGAEVFVDGGIEIREGRLGGFSIHIPEEVTRIEYVVEKDDRGIPPQEIQRLWEVMPKHPCFVPEHQQYLAEGMRAFAKTPEDLARLDYAALIESGLTYTMDPFVIALQERSKNALSETLLGLRMGICDSFAYTVARRMNNLSLPALTVAGLITERSNHGDLIFNLKEGHAQAALVTESGPLIFDATLHASPDTINSSSLGWYERAEALLSICQGTYRDAYEKARHIGERLRGEVDRKEEALGWFGSLYRLWHIGLVPSGDYSRTIKPPYSFSEDVRIDDSEKVLARALMVKSYDDGLRSAVREGLLRGSLSGVYQYLENKLTVEIAEVEKTILPAELQFLVAYNPTREVIAYTNSAILEKRLTRDAIGESFDWILTTFPSLRRDLPSRKSRQLDLKEAAQYSDDVYLSQMTPEHQVRFARATTSLILDTLFAGRELESDIQRIFAEKDHLQVATLVERSSPDALTCGFVALNTFLRSGKEALMQEPESTINELYDIVTQLAAGVGYSLEYSDHLFEDLRYQYEHLTRARATLLNALPNWGETLSSVLLKGDLSHVFPDVTGVPEIPCLASLLSSPVADISATTYFERVIISQVFSEYLQTFDYSDVLERARGLGFPQFSLVPYRESIERMVLERALAIPENERCNFPSNDHPISQLVHDLCDNNAGAVLRLATVLKEQGGISDSITQRWPPVDEKQVADRSERYFLLTQDLELCGLPRYVSAPIDLRSYPEYLQLLMPAGDRAGECLKYLVGAEIFNRKPESAVVSALSFPKFVDFVRSSHQSSPLFFEKIVSKPLKRSLGDTAHVYHLLLGRSAWLHGDESSTSSQQKLSCFLSDYDSEALTEDMRAKKAAVLLSDFPHDIRGLPSLSERSKIEFLLLCYLSNSDRNTFEALTARSLPEETEECLKGLNGRTVPELWRQQMKQCKPVVAHADAAWEESQKWIAQHTGLQSFRAPYQRFLQHAAGPVYARGISGEFTDYREYRKGDELRLIDHKASARLGKTLVRLYDEREVRDINLVYDADLLLDADSFKVGDSVNKAMVDLFSHLHLAQLQGVNIDLWICHRGGVSHLPNLTRAHHRGGQSHYTTAAFREELSQALSSYYGLRCFEDDWLDDPISDQSLLTPCADKLVGDRILVCRIDDENIGANMPMLSFLRRKGAKIAIVRSNVSEILAINNSNFEEFSDS